MSRRNDALWFKDQGFTFIELLIVLALMSLTLGWTHVAYQQWLINLKLELTARNLFSALQFARSYALFSQSKIIFCKSQEGRYCGGHWEQGSLIAKRQNNKDFSQLKTIKYFHFLSSTQTLTWRGARGIEHVQFDETGASMGHNGRFILCDRSRRSQVAWIIYISYTGRIRLEKSNRLSTG